MIDLSLAKDHLGPTLYRIPEIVCSGQCPAREHLSILTVFVDFVIPRLLEGEVVPPAPLQHLSYMLRALHCPSVVTYRLGEGSIGRRYEFDCRIIGEESHEGL